MLINMLVLAGNHRFQGNKRNFKGGRKQHSVPNAHLRSEIKDVDQVRKERQKKANKISHMKSKSQNGKKFGKNGKYGKRGKSK